MLPARVVSPVNVDEYITGKALSAKPVSALYNACVTAILYLRFKFLGFSDGDGLFLSF